MPKEIHTPSAEERQQYVLGVIRKQSGCSSEEAEEIFKQLSNSQVEQLEQAARSLDLHTVRRILELPAPGTETGVVSMEIGLDEAVELAGLYRFAHLRSHSVDGQPPRPVIVLEKVPDAPSDEQEPAAE